MYSVCLCFVSGLFSALLVWCFELFELVYVLILLWLCLMLFLACCLCDCYLCFFGCWRFVGLLYVCVCLICALVWVLNVGLSLTALFVRFGWCVRLVWFMYLCWLFGLFVIVFPVGLFWWFVFGNSVGYWNSSFYCDFTCDGLWLVLWVDCL